MIKHCFKSSLLLLIGLLPVTSCSLLSGSGPLKRSFSSKEMPYHLVEVKSPADIPAARKSSGRADTPALSRGKGYSDRIRSRDELQFVITDLDQQSPFYTTGSPYKYGPIEIPEDGTVEFPYVGEIQVLHKTLAEVSADLSQKVLPVSNTARASVTRTARIEFTANVMGDVKTPGPVKLNRNGITSLDLLAACGGTTRAEHLYFYNLRRDGRDYDFDYTGLRNSPFLVEEGDLLTVTLNTSNRFHVMGAIIRPTTVPFPVPSPTLADAIGAAVGLDERRSDPSGIFVFRKGDPATVYTFNMRDPAVISLIQSFPLHGEDIVYVTEAPLTRWNRLITQILPISISQAANSAYRYVQ